MIAEKKIEELDTLRTYLEALKSSQMGDTSAMDNYIEWQLDNGMAHYLVELYYASQSSTEFLKIIKQTSEKRIKELIEDIEHQEELYELLVTNLPDTIVQRLNSQDWNIIGNVDGFALLSSDGLYRVTAELQDGGYVLSNLMYDNNRYDFRAFIEKLG